MPFSRLIGAAVLPTIHALNIALALALIFAPVWFSRRYLRLPLLNPFTIAVVLSLPVQVMKLFAGPFLLIDEGLSDAGYQFALLMGNLLVVAQTAGLLFFFWLFRNARVEKSLPLQGIILKPRDLRRAARLLLLLFAASLYLLSSAEFGVWNWLANPREGYQLHRTGQGHWYALATSALGSSYLLYFLARPTAPSILRKLALFLALGYLLGSKFVLLSIFGAAIVFLWFIRWRHLGTLIVIGAPVVFGIALWNLYLSVGEGFDLTSIVEYFDYYKNAADYYREYLSGNVQLYLGEISLTSFWSYVPRALWPDKPVVYGVLIINELFYPGAAELTNTPAFGGAVEQFADFGVIGVLLLGFFSGQAVLTALLSYLIFVRPGVRFDRVSLAAVAMMLVQFAPAFGLYFPTGLYLTLLVFVLVMTLAVRASRRRLVRTPSTLQGHDVLARGRVRG